MRRARELGFTLDEVRTLLTLAVEDGQDICADARQLAVKHLAEVPAKIVDLCTLESALSEAVRRRDAGEAPGCPLIDALFAPRAAAP